MNLCARSLTVLRAVPRKLVWKDTVHVGCGGAICKFGAFVVCEYDPPGNEDGQFNSQVFVPQSNGALHLPFHAAMPSTQAFLSAHNF
jgi:hypothetical protein